MLYSGYIEVYKQSWELKLKRAWSHSEGGSKEKATVGAEKKNKV